MKQGDDARPSKSRRLYEMLKTGSVELTIDGVSFGRAKIIESSKRDVETFPLIERVSMTIQFSDD